MIKKMNLFKMLSLSLLCLNVFYLIFSLSSSILAIKKLSILSNIHFIIFIIILAFNLLYFMYVFIKLILNYKRIKNKKNNY